MKKMFIYLFIYMFIGEKMVNCFICKARHLKRPINRIQLIYPEKKGNIEFVPVCRKCQKKYFKVIVQIQNNPKLKVKYIPIPK